VVINANLSCGVCEACVAGLDNRCRTWRLLGEHVAGTYAEFVVVPSVNVLPIPESVSFEEAAAASLVFHTAWHSLITRGRLRPGETVLIVGASGGVNTACLQVAKLAGATVLVVGSNREKLELAGALGADLLFDRSLEEDWSRTVFEATGRRGVDIVVDNVMGPSLSKSLRAARKGGRILTVGNTGGATVELDNRYLFGKHLSLIGSTMGTRQEFHTVMELLFEGRLHPVIDRSFPLPDVVEAQQRLADGEQQGKIVLRIA
jgi:NADPH:quinone reductase-like Zn-dependent oxidoreductase